MIISAPMVVTMSGAPIRDGAVRVVDDTIVAVTKAGELSPDPGEEVIHLGEHVLAPGLINAHCHLDYTMLRKVISRPSSFTTWIQRLNAMKRGFSDEDYLAAIAQGFAELKKWGTTTVLNLEAFPELLIKMPPPPIRTWWFYELLDLREVVATEEVVAGALAFFEERPGWLGGFGLSPHAPYTASAELYRLADSCAVSRGMLLTTHLAESAEERMMFERGEGPLFVFLHSLGRDMSDCGRGSSAEKLVGSGPVRDGWIVAHANELSDRDFDLFARHRPHVVHCPRSHRYFSHSRFQYRRLEECGVNISVGTDSLASNDRLDLFSELRTLRKTVPELTGQELMRTVTVHPARALGLPDRLGRLAPGAFADMIAVPWRGRDEVYDEIVETREPVRWMMINGKMV